MAAVRRWYKLRRRRLYNFGLFFIQRDVASPAEVIGCAKLNQKAMVAPYNFPGIDRGKISGHLQVGVARAGKTRNPTHEFQLLCGVCGTKAVEVKRKFLA